MRIEIEYFEGYGAFPAQSDGPVNPVIIDKAFKYEFWYMTGYLRIYHSRRGYQEFGLNGIKAVYADGALVHEANHTVTEQYSSHRAPARGSSR